MVPGARRNNHKQRVNRRNKFVCCHPRKLISHPITPPPVHNGDVKHRLPEIAQPFQVLAAALIVFQDYPSLATDLATSIPGFRNSPTIRGEPQPGLAADILRINALISSDTVGLPGLPCLLNLSPMIAKALQQGST